MAKIFLVGILFVFAGDLEAQLLLYGGENSDQFLGCLSCGLVEEESVQRIRSLWQRNVSG